MDNMNQLKGPVVIGGIGGSGTRVVAEILSELGFYLGNDLNHAKDNLWFTVLFKRPNWFRNNSDNKDEIFRMLRIMSKAMSERGFLYPSDLMFLISSIMKICIKERDCIDRPGMLQQIFLVVKIAVKMIASIKGVKPKYIGWGWKEPNSHIYLNYMAECFENLKYIHTVRHGLDMAFSKNQQQLFNWGPFFGLEKSRIEVNIPRASLKYWIRANQRATDMRNIFGPEKVLMINFDKLCLSADSEIEKIIKFLEVKPIPEVRAKLEQISKVPRSMGRYRTKDLSLLDDNDIRAVERFGFLINK